MVGLSTVSTYDRTWKLALRFSAGAFHEALTDIRRIENAVNGIARGAFRGVSHYCRGESAGDARRASRYRGRRLHYSHASLSSDLTAALWFASGGRYRPGEAKVVLAIGTHRARSLGVFPATYSLVNPHVCPRGPPYGFRMAQTDL